MFSDILGRSEKGKQHHFFQALRNTYAVKVSDDVVTIPLVAQVAGYTIMNLCHLNSINYTRWLFVIVYLVTTWAPTRYTMAVFYRVPSRCPCRDSLVACRVPWSQISTSARRWLIPRAVCDAVTV